MKDLPIENTNRFYTWLLLGRSGAGKTKLSATAPKPIFIDSNVGTASIEYIKDLGKVRRTPQITKIEQLDDVYDQLTGTSGSKVDWSKKFSTPVFDSWDDMQVIIMDRLISKAMEKAADTNMDEDEAEQLQLRQYGIMYNKLSRYMRKMKKIKKHRIFICSEKFSEEHDMMWPNLVGQMRERLPYLVDHTLYLRVNDKGVRYLHLNAKQGEFYAKTRASWLPDKYHKIRVDPKDTTLLTDLFALIAAGPKGLRAWKRR
jgi:hypothetical protein